MYNKSEKSIIAGFFTLTPTDGKDYFYPASDPIKILPWRNHYGAGTYDTNDFGWIPPKAGYYKASLTGRVRYPATNYPQFNLNFHVAIEGNVNIGSIGSIYVPAGIKDSYCVHAEFFFHVDDPTKKIYFRGYNGGNYPTMAGYIMYVNDANLTYEFIGE